MQVHTLPQARRSPRSTATPWPAARAWRRPATSSIAAESARIGYPEVRRGLVAAIVMHDLIRQVGDRRAGELLLTGDADLRATRPSAGGWSTASSPPSRCLDEAIALGRALVDCGPVAVATTKRLLDEASGRPPTSAAPRPSPPQVRVSDEAAGGAAPSSKAAARWALRADRKDPVARAPETGDHPDGDPIMKIIIKL